LSRAIVQDQAIVVVRGVATMTEQPVVLVETDVGWQIGVQVEAAKSRLVVVFLPEGSPFRVGV
jgi:hypothetical protein